MRAAAAERKSSELESSTTKAKDIQNAVLNAKMQACFLMLKRAEGMGTAAPGLGIISSPPLERQVRRCPLLLRLSNTFVNEWVGVFGHNLFTSVTSCFCELRVWYHHDT